MPSSARVGDMWTGQCCCHSDPTCIGMSGVIVSGSPNDISSGSPQARLGDMTIGGCGHTGIIVTASTTCNANSAGKARVGDQVTGCNIGIIVAGNPIHIVGG